MNRARYSAIAHGDLRIWNPLSINHLEQYVAAISLPMEGAVLDIGCGPGYLLKRILTLWDVVAIGVDSSPFAITAARRNLAELPGERKFELLERSFRHSDFAPAAFDMVICLGATHAVGGYRETLKAAARLLRTRGLLLVGDGYWKQTPSADYLAILQMAENDQSRWKGAVAEGEREGFELLLCSECTLEEWDDYEAHYAVNVENYVRSTPDDPDSSFMLERSGAWRNAYRRWGRNTLGFGLYLFRWSLPSTP
jgi:cyclopropane fatty-acyl-phospholipid synthase-like methyltransferase